MDKRTVKLVMIVAMLLVVALYFIGGTYARYIDEFTGTASVNVAKWAVKVAGEETEEFTLKLKEQTNENVVDGLIAPDVTLESEPIAIDLTGTEVAVDVDAKIDPSELASALTELGLSKDDITTDVKIYKGDTKGESAIGSNTIALPTQNSGFTEDNGKYCVVVTVQWKEDATHNESDTQAGRKSATQNHLTLEIPVKLTLKQHLSKDVG